MLKFAVLLLLCAVILRAQMPDLFQGCVRYRRKHEEPHKCTLRPRSTLRGNVSFKYFAHLALRDGNIQPATGHLNTFLRMTRVATQNYRSLKDFNLRVEFTTTMSKCAVPEVYNATECLPIGGKANGLCQAKFKKGMAEHFFLDIAWCKPKQ